MQIAHKLSRRKQWSIAILTVVTVGVVLGLSLGLIVGRDSSNNNKNNNEQNDLPAPEPTVRGQPPEGKYALPEPIKGTIPHNKNYITLDPGLIRRHSDGKLFLFTTGHKNGTVWTADSLYGPWKKQSHTLLQQQAGGPDVHYFADTKTYWLFTNSHKFNYAKEQGLKNPEAKQYFHDASILVHSSKTLEHGSWTAHGRLDIPWDAKYNILDPSLLSIKDTDGMQQNLLSFGSYQTGVYQIPLANPPSKLADNAVSQMVHLEHNTTSTHDGKRDRTEASFQYARGGWYYLFYSSGRCCPQNGDWTEAIANPYRVMVCRSSRPLGGFVDKEGKDCLEGNGGTEILSSHGEVFAPGGQGAMDDDEVSSPILYYHYVPYNNTTKRIGPGYRFGWNKLQFDANGWPVIK